MKPDEKGRYLAYLKKKKAEKNSFTSVRRREPDKTSEPDYSVINQSKALKLKFQRIDKANPNELKFRRMLIQYGIRHVWQQPFSCAKRFVCVDFYLPKYNVAIEIDGQNYSDTADIDLERTMYLKRTHKVAEVLRITNGQLAKSPELVIELVLSKFM